MLPDKYESRAHVYVQTETILEPVLNGVVARPDYARRVEVMTLQTSIRYIDVLALYVWFLIAAPLLVVVLVRWGVGAAVVVAAAVPAVDMALTVDVLRGRVVWLEDGELTDGLMFVAPRWFSLFAVGIVLGWCWPRVWAAASSETGQRVLVGSALGFVAVARLDAIGVAAVVPPGLIDKVHLGPLLVVNSVVLALALLVMIERLVAASSVGAAVGGGLEALGAASLAVYVLHLAVHLGLDLAVGHPFPLGWGWLGVALFAAAARVWTRRRIAVRPSGVSWSRTRPSSARIGGG